MNVLKIILGPIISEKSMNEASKGRYTFKVFMEAGKKDIKKAVEENFKVNVLKISTAVIKGRSAKAGARRTQVVKSPFKKAIVTVKTGQKIALFDVGTQK